MPRDLRVNVGTAGILVEWDRLLRPDGRPDAILCMRRHPEHDHCGGDWQFPGGWLDFGEQPGDGVAREFKEEVGLEVVAATSPLFAVASTYEDPERHIVTLFYEVVQVHPGEPRNMEPDKADYVEFLRWAELEDGRPLMPPVAQYLGGR